MTKVDPFNIGSVETNREKQELLFQYINIHVIMFYCYASQVCTFLAIEYSWIPSKICFNSD